MRSLYPVVFFPVAKKLGPLFVKGGSVSVVASKRFDATRNFEWSAGLFLSGLGVEKSVDALEFGQYGVQLVGCDGREDVDSRRPTLQGFGHRG